MLRKERIPKEIKEYGSQWVAWKAEERVGGKPGKVPKSPGNGQNASVSAPETWASFSEVVKGYESGGYQGIGFMLTESDPYVGVDLDDCRDPETGQIEGWAMEIVRKLNSYSEISPSGTGLRIIIKGILPPEGCKKGNVEMYSSKRFVTVTGDHLDGTPLTIEERNAEIIVVHREVFGGEKPSNEEKLIQRIKASPQGAKFSRLMAGNWETEYESRSEADLALCSILSYWTDGDADRMDEVFRTSGLMRPKWDRDTGGRTYGEITISRAINNRGIYKREGLISKEEISPEEYFDKAIFIPKRLADTLMKKYHIKYAAGQLWIYEGGVYRPNGRSLLEEEAQSLLGEECRDNRINETIKYIERETRTELSKPTTAYINLKNGRLYWREGRLEPHDPKHFDITQLPVEYDPDAICPEFDRYLKTSLTPDVIPLVEEVLGHTLIPDTRYEKGVLLLGPGANGKSVFLDIVRGLLGEANCASVALQDLAQDRFKSAQLLGKLVNIFADLDQRELKNTGVLKALVTGDYITAEEKFKPPFQFKNVARLLFSANQIPESPDKSYAYKRRWIVIPFLQIFTEETRDTGLRERLLKPEELSGILNRALRGLRRLEERGRFSEPGKVAEARKPYDVKQSTFTSFALERLEASPNQQIRKQYLYQEYETWCKKRGVKPASQKVVKQILTRMFPGAMERREENSGPWCWEGIKLRE